MLHRAFLAAPLAVLGLAALAWAGEPPKDKPKDPPKGNGEGKPPAKPPGEQPPAQPPDKPPAEEPGKPDLGLHRELDKIYADLKNPEDPAKRGKAVEALVKVESDDPTCLAKLMNYLTMVLFNLQNLFSSEQRQACGERLCALANKHRDQAALRFDDKIRTILGEILTKDKSNADPRVCLPLLRHLLEIGHPDSLKDAKSCILNFRPEGVSALLGILRCASNPQVLDILIEIALDKSNKNLVLRRECVKWLGAWGNLPPLYAKRVPALLEALDSPATTEAALESLQRICLPALEQAQAWKNWWKRTLERPAQGKDDLEIIREDLKEVFERKRETERDPGAVRIGDWMSDWNGPWFKWAVPVLLDPMLKEKPYEHPEVRSRVISLLGTIGDLAAVPVLETLSQQIKPEKTAQRAQLREVILGMARIAAMGDAAKREEVGKSLAAHLENIYPDVVQAAAEAMGLLRYEPSRQKLVGILNKTTSLGAAMKAAEALGKMQAKDCLGEGADAKDAEGNLRILPMLAKSLEEKDLMSLALSLVKALRDMNVRNRGVVDHLILAIMSPHDGVCQEAMLLVGGEWKDESALGPINEVFKDARNRNVPLRKCALQVLAAYPPERGATYLFPVLRCPKAATRKDPKKAAEEELFARIAVQYFDKPGNILPEHRTELLSIVSDADNNNRAACIRWVSLKGIWKSEECVDKLVPRFEEDDRDLVDAARLAFRSHPSALACLRMIQALPKNPPPNPRWQDFQKNDVVDWYFYNNYKGKEDPPKVMLNGKELEAWFKKNEKHFEWQAEE